MNSQLDEEYGAGFEGTKALLYKYIKDTPGQRIQQYMKTKSLSEILKKSDPVGDWIRDFIDSDNSRFAGKSKKERINMALGAYYAAQRNESVEEQTKTNGKKMSYTAQVRQANKEDRAKRAAAWRKVFSNLRKEEDEIELEEGTGHEVQQALKAALQHRLRGVSASQINRYIDTENWQAIADLMKGLTDDEHELWAKNGYDGRTYELMMKSRERSKSYKDAVEKMKNTLGVKESELNEAQNLVSKGIYTLDGKKIEGARSSKLFLQALDSDGFLHNLSWKEWSESNLKDTSSDYAKQQFIDRLAKQIKMFNKRIDLNTWLKGGNRSFTDIVNYIFKLDPNIKYSKTIGLKEETLGLTEKIDVEELLDAAVALRKKNPQLRKGQSIMIALHGMDKKAYDNARNKADAFNNDSKIPQLIQLLDPSYYKEEKNLEESPSLETLRLMKIVSLATGSKDADALYEYVCTSPSYSSIVELKENFNKYIQQA